MGTATGTATHGLTLTTTIPDDAALIVAADVNVPVQALLDNDAYLASRGLVGAYAYTYDNASFVLPEIFSTTSYVAASLVTLDVPNTVAGDILAIDLAGLVEFDGASGHTGDIRLKLVEQFGGGAPTTVNPAGARLIAHGLASGFSATSSFTCKRVVASAGTARVTVEGKVSNGGDNIYLVNVVTLRVLHLRTS